MYVIFPIFAGIITLIISVWSFVLAITNDADLVIIVTIIPGIIVGCSFLVLGILPLKNDMTEKE